MVALKSKMSVRTLLESVGTRVYAYSLEYFIYRRGMFAHYCYMVGVSVCGHFNCEMFTGHSKQYSMKDCGGFHKVCPGSLHKLENRDVWHEN